MSWIGARKDWQFTCRRFDEALVCLPPHALDTHALIIGKTGSGKSVLLQHIVAGRLLRGESFVVLDPRGDSALTTLELLSRANVSPKRVLFFDLRDKENPKGFNPLVGPGEPYFRALAFVDAIAAESESWGVQLGETIRNATMLIAEAGGTITDFEGLFYDPAVRHRLVSRAQSETVIEFWRRYDSLSADRQNALAAPVLNKVSLLTAVPALRRVFGHPNPADLSTHLNTPGSVTLISLAVDELHAAGYMAGSLLLSSICREIFSRVNIPEKERNPVRLFVDEFEHFSMKDFETIVVEGRRFKFSVVLSHQSLAQLSPKMRSLILGNVGVKVVFGTAYRDAEILNKDLTGASKTFDLPSLPVGHAVLWRNSEVPIEIEVNAPLVRNVGSISPRARRLLEGIETCKPRIAQMTPKKSVEDEKTHDPSSSLRRKPKPSNLEDWLK